MRLIIYILLFLFSQSISNAENDSLKSIGQKTASMRSYKGFLTYYWDEKSGKIWLKIDRLDEEFLYVTYLSRGIGSNDIGLDRGQLGSTRVVKFIRSGPKILLLQPNYKYRANSTNLWEKKAIEESFAQSVIAGFKIGAQTGNHLLIDATDFLLRDSHNISGRLKETKQGDFSLDMNRSFIYLPRCKNFQRNSELEVLTTFSGTDPGNWLSTVVPDEEALTVYQHHSFVKLPDDGYQPRRYDPRSGYFGISYLDYSVPIDQPIRQQFIARHRLEKQIADAEMSPAKKPIIYYVDRGAPELIRSALLEGAGWWSEAFKSAGYTDAFRVELLPDDADPLDVRYNIIQWVHRSTRGWSYGSSVIDPRTGEIIKGHITLGSLRIRQDYLIAEGLLAPYTSVNSQTNHLKDLALARIRQLSAHEVGHTLGLQHNFAASSSDRASVMDYPHPMVRLTSNDEIDISNAYDSGIGEWDKVTINYGYRQFKSNEDEELTSIINNYIKSGMRYISDRDARPQGGAHPLAHLWDNNADAVSELERLIEIRQKLLSRFSEKNIPHNRPMAELETVLVPVYLLHRYQVQAAAKLLGGMDYSYAMRGDGQIINELVDPFKQREALNILLKTLSPQFLQLPEHILKLLPPHPPGYNRTRENFPSQTGITFDLLSVASTSAKISLDLLLHPHRAGRLIEFHSRDEDFPHFQEVLDKLLDLCWENDIDDGVAGEIQKTVQLQVMHRLMEIMTMQDINEQVKVFAFTAMNHIKSISLQKSKDEIQTNRAHYMFVQNRILRFLEKPESFLTFQAPIAPPGQPIGTDSNGLKNPFCDW
jgi:hypothetical protein